MKPTLVGLLLIACPLFCSVYSQSLAVQEIDSLRMMAQQLLQDQPELTLQVSSLHGKIDQKIKSLPSNTYPAESLYRFYYEEALPLVNQHLAIIKTKKQRQYFLQVEAPFIEGTLHACYQLFQQKKDPRYLEKAFAIIEKQKLPFSQFPDMLPVETSGQLRHLEGQIRSLRDSIRLEDTAERRSRMLGWQEKLDVLHRAILKDFPAYARFLSFYEMADLGAVRAQLAPEEAVIDYFIGPRFIYALLIRADTLTLTEVSIGESGALEDLVESYLESLQEPARYLEFVPAAHQLYQWLLAPLADHLAAEDRITIIPDAIMQLIPFEPLLRRLPEKRNYDYANLDYLIWHFQFAYHRSATELSKQRSAERDAEQAPSIVAFAPGFGEQLHRQYQAYPEYRQDDAYLSFDSLAHLTHNLEWLQSNLHATTFKWEQANQLNFKEHFQNDILHLGTHLVADPEYLMESKIVLAKTQQADGQLDQGYITLQDLNQWELQTQFAILAACTSGKDGYGFAYAFESSGISSTLYALWMVNDKESAQVIQSFYEYLQVQEPKDRALHLAKRKYLQSVKDLKLAPKYWAVFVFNGDPRAFAFPPPGEARPMVYVLGFSFAFVLAIFLLLFQKRRESEKEPPRTI